MSEKIRGNIIKHPFTGEDTNRSQLAAELYRDGTRTRKEVMEIVNKAELKAGTTLMDYTTLHIILTNDGQATWNEADKKRREEKAVKKYDALCSQLENRISKQKELKDKTEQELNWRIRKIRELEDKLAEVQAANVSEENVNGAS